MWKCSEEDGDDDDDDGGSGNEDDSPMCTKEQMATETNRMIAAVVTTVVALFKSFVCRAYETRTPHQTRRRMRMSQDCFALFRNAKTAATNNRFVIDNLSFSLSNSRHLLLFLLLLLRLVVSWTILWVDLITISTKAKRTHIHSLLTAVHCHCYYVLFCVLQQQKLISVVRSGKRSRVDFVHARLVGCLMNK